MGDVISYEDDVPDHKLLPMTAQDGAEMLRSAFYSGQMNSLRAVERQQALLQARNSAKIPLEDYEHYFHKAQVVEMLLEGGATLAQRYCEDRDFTPEDTEKLISDAKSFIIAASNEYASAAKENAIARYNLLFQRLYEQRDFKGCALIQRCLDRLQGVDDPNQVTDDFTQGLLSVMKRVAAEERTQLKELGSPQPLLRVANGPNTVEEVVQGSNIRVEHPCP